MLRLWIDLQDRLGKDSDGASMLEYAILVAVIAMVIVSAALFLGTALSQDFSQVADTLQAS
jgi:Flp pilus assembly pilin Flp